jgi:predicted NBD/HSP70 family sugar kinase
MDLRRSGTVLPSGASDLFQTVRDGVPRTRAELAALTGLARSTVGIRIDELVAAGLVAPWGQPISSGGRPPSRFAMDPRARVLLAVDCGATHHTVAITDLAGSVLAIQERRRPIADGPVAVLGSIVDSATELIASLDRSTADLAAAGIGLPGPVEHATGRAIDPPIMPGWDDFDVPAWIEEHLGIPALVDNDVNIMAIGERSIAHPEIDDLLFVKVATGIGAGIVSGGTLQRGAQGSAGDIGHIPVPSGDGVRCECGRIGCLEAVASGPAIARRLPGARTSADVVALVHDGDAAAIAAVTEAGRAIGGVLAACVSVTNPELIVLGGAMAEAGEPLLQGIREVIDARGPSLATARLRIVRSGAGESAGVLGAAALAADHALSPAGIDAVLARGPLAVASTPESTRESATRKANA